MPSPLKSALILLTLTWLSGCAPIPYGESQFNLVAASSSNEWERRISREPGEIQFTTQLEQGSYSQIFFTNGNSGYAAPFRIELSDMDCDAGHEVIIEYRDTPSDIYRKYFDTIIPWGRSALISIRWRADGEVEVTLEEETLGFTPYQKPSKVIFRNLSGQLPITRFAYIAKDK